MNCEHCDVCGFPYQTVWRVSDTIWEQVIGDLNINLICPSCFDVIAREIGLELFWEASINEYPTDTSFPCGESRL